ncbi:AmpG family muropeptide MFS transporter [Varunaivibrio sulfuroxidans]|uniref:PAT family beta-lactamase induction signal transducer AmpG n=1 Tax=Varunaivibrio sulfuroxidans TaxID=1773489 RepID=A0A4V2UPE7_9PROT|nr:AmpG family muropeptide MFS transporter [Varunaivibrio sulfuroxidans]TCS64921.1 PAT family beta-lactamase induction signal transducer AmpG [Varunaivibrio sulfuroxidans]WES29785.1 AmpG family muropeptide MFS transporter [Varunaivibrio sulfuroxidans]
MRTWLSALEVYRDRRVLSLLFLGFSSGLPFGVLADPLSAWLVDEGVSKTEIGLFALVSLPYSIKFLWSPIMDKMALPLFTRLFGRRRGWVLFTQLVLLAAIGGMGMTMPGVDPWWTAALALAVAFSSASQDIVIDAYRVEILPADKLAAGAATAVFGWRLGQVGGGAAGLIFADIFPWQAVFWGMAAFVLVGIVAILINPEPVVRPSAESEAREQAVEDFLERKSHLRPWLAETLAWLYGAVVCPFADFMTRRGWGAILLFILLYKYGDAILAVMKVPFFLDIGFSKTEIAAVVKIFGFNAIIAGGVLGGVVLARFGMMRGLLLCGVLMAASNLVFVVQAWVGPDPRMLAVTVAVENITTGMGTTAFVAYLSSLCTVAYTASQYALLTSFMAFSRTLMSSGGGWLADQVNWVTFFVLTTLAAIPGLLLLLWMIRRFPPQEASPPPDR